MFGLLFKTRMLSKISAVALLAAAATTGAVSISHERLATYTFEQYVKDFKHPWAAGSVEWKERETIFNTQINKIRAHNEDSSKSWKETVNQFTAWTSAEKKVCQKIFLFGGDY